MFDLGASIANQLEERMSQREVAKALGITHQGVRAIECRALAKVAKRLIEIANANRR